VTVARDRLRATGHAFISTGALDDDDGHAVGRRRCGGQVQRVGEMVDEAAGSRARGVKRAQPRARCLAWRRAGGRGDALGRRVVRAVVVAVRLADVAGLPVFRLGCVLVAAANRSKGRSQRLDFFLGMDESHGSGVRNSMR